MVGADVGTVVGLPVGELVMGALVGFAVGVAARVGAAVVGDRVAQGFDIALVVKVLSLLSPVPQLCVVEINIILSIKLPCVILSWRFEGLCVVTPQVFTYSKSL